MRYAERDAALHTELFVKIPHCQARKREKYMCACVYQQDGPEIAFAQRYAAEVPVRAPKTYFADRNAQSCNFILVTEKLAYASEAQHAVGTRASLPPHALQRPYTKLADHHIGRCGHSAATRRSHGGHAPWRLHLDRTAAPQ